MLPTEILANVAAFLSLDRITNAATASEWTSRSLYRVSMDRLALSNGSTPGWDLVRYYGGRWKGSPGNQISPGLEKSTDHTISSDDFRGHWPVKWHAPNEEYGNVEEMKDVGRPLCDGETWSTIDMVMTSDTALNQSSFIPIPVWTETYNTLYICISSTQPHLQNRYCINRKRSSSEETGIVAAYSTSPPAISERSNMTIEAKSTIWTGEAAAEVWECKKVGVEGEGKLTFWIDKGSRALYSVESLVGFRFYGRAFVKVGSGSDRDDDEDVEDVETEVEEGEKKSEGASVHFKARASFAGGALGALFLCAMVWL